jgi:hypothetical protein
MSWNGIDGRHELRGGDRYLTGISRIPRNIRQVDFTVRSGSELLKLLSFLSR